MVDSHFFRYGRFPFTDLTVGRQSSQKREVVVVVAKKVSLFPIHGLDCGPAKANKREVVVVVAKKISLFPSHGLDCS